MLTHIKLQLCTYDEQVKHDKDGEARIALQSGRALFISALVGPSRFHLPYPFFGSDASRAGTGRPGTLVCRRCGAFRCCVLC